LPKAAAACESEPLKKVPGDAGKADTPLTTPAMAIARYFMLVRQDTMGGEKGRDGYKTRTSDGMYSRREVALQCQSVTVESQKEG
jgi:hypothetical protein